MTERGHASVAIVGGGASGTILAAHLLKSPRPDLRVTVVERRSSIGYGLAYSTQSDQHRLNVPAGRMSAYGDDPLHFWNWLKRQGLAEGDDSNVFVARHLYGRYLDELFQSLLEQERETGRLRACHDQCVAVVPAASGVEIRLADGVSLATRVAVLATGHDPDPAPEQGGSGRNDEWAVHTLAI